MQPKDKGDLPDDYVLSARYSRKPYDLALTKIEGEIDSLNDKIAFVIGLRAKDTGLAPPALWNFEHDRKLIQTEKALRVGTIL